MMPVEERIRLAIRETADEIPEDPPPLRLDSQRRPGRRRAGMGRRGWHAWAAPLGSGALVVAVIIASLALARGVHRPQAASRPQPANQSLGLGVHPVSAAPVGPDGVPPYYVALTTSQKSPDNNVFQAVAAEVRATATGAVLAKIVPPKPYVAFTGITAAVDDRTFMLVAQGPNHPPKTTQQYAREYPHGYNPPTRFFLLRIDPSAESSRATLLALPARFIPANQTVINMALSPDGTSLAATIGGLLFDSHLYDINLMTGTERAWSLKTCSQCFPSAGGLGTGGVQGDALSWTADGRHIAFIGPDPANDGGAVRLLDITKPGTDLLANSKIVAPWPGGPNNTGPDWRGGIITPDGRTVLIVEEVIAPRAVRQRLVKVSAATGRVTATLNDLNVMNGYEQVMYTNATGNVLVVGDAREGDTAGILQGDRYTPIPWAPYTATAAW